MATGTPSIIKPKRLPEFAGILREEEHFGTGREDSASDRVNSWFDQLMLHSGAEISPAVVTMLCVLCGITLGGAIFVWNENPLLAAVAFVVGTVLPVGMLLIMRSRRQMLMTRQLPDMVDELARAARTGRSLEQCLDVVAHDTPNPLGHEMRLCTRRLNMGLDVREALHELPERTGLVSLGILRSALVVHHETGGDLVSVLERLSRTIRDRLAYLGRLKAATAASRATAILMIAIPPAIVLFFCIRDPEYLTNLMGSAWGRLATLTACILEFVGAVWVLRILGDSQKG